MAFPSFEHLAACKPTFRFPCANAEARRKEGSVAGARGTVRATGSLKSSSDRAAQAAAEPAAARYCAGREQEHSRVCIGQGLL